MRQSSTYSITVRAVMSQSDNLTVPSLKSVRLSDWRQAQNQTETRAVQQALNAKGRDEKSEEPNTARYSDTCRDEEQLLQQLSLRCLWKAFLYAFAMVFSTGGLIPASYITIGTVVFGTEDFLFLLTFVDDDDDVLILKLYWNWTLHAWTSRNYTEGVH